MDRIKFIDLRPMGHSAGILNVAYDRVFNSSRYIGGKEVEAFENEWAEYCESKYCVGVGNGHDALMLACKYYARGYNPYIYTPWKTCLPTWSAIRNADCIPYPCSLDYDNILVAVHIYGQIIIPHYFATANQGRLPGYS